MAAEPEAAVSASVGGCVCQGIGQCLRPRAVRTRNRYALRPAADVEATVKVTVALVPGVIDAGLIVAVTPVAAFTDRATAFSPRRSP